MKRRAPSGAFHNLELHCAPVYPAMEYSASFTAGGLLMNEFEALLPELVGSDNGLILNGNQLKVASEGARKRLITEIRKRLQYAKSDFWVFYENADLNDRRLLLFFLSLSSYRLVREYHYEVSLKNARRLQWNIDPYDYELYLSTLTGRNNIVASWSDATRLKTITNYLRMLREAGLADKSILKKVAPSRTLVARLMDTGADGFLDACFLTDNDKKAYTK
ncbi:MAG: BrxA family protein [Chitinophagaceae bacterium]